MENKGRETKRYARERNRYARESAKKRKKGEFCLKEGFGQSGVLGKVEKVFLGRREGGEKGAEKGMEGWKGMKTQKRLKTERRVDFRWQITLYPGQEGHGF